MASQSSARFDRDESAPTKFDVIIIGAGMAGLSAAAYLSSKGLRIALFERHGKCGGVVHCFKREGFTFEASTHQVSSMNHPRYMPRVLRLLDLKQIKPVKSEFTYESILFDPENSVIRQRYLLPSGLPAITRQLNTSFPHEAESIRTFSSYMRLCGEEAYTLKCVAREPRNFPLDAILALMLKNGRGLFKGIGRTRFKGVVTYGSKNYQQVLSSIKDPILRWVLSAYTAYTGSSAAEVNAFVMGSLIYGYFSDGPYLFQGGTSTVVANLTERIAHNGGTIFLKHPIRKIHVQGDSVTGVETESGQIHTARAVVSSIDARDTCLHLTDAQKLPEVYRTQIAGVTYTPSAFQIYLGLSINPKEYGFIAPTSFFDPTLDDEKRHRLMMASTTPESRTTTPFVFTNYSETALGLTPEGQTAACIAELCPMDDWDQLSDEAYTRKKSEMQEVILTKVERITGIPLRSNARVIFSATPRTMKYYGGNSDGAIMGAALSVEQCLKKRTSIETPLKNLFLAGSSIAYPGMGSCIDSGIISANVLLKRLRRLKS
jgi:phytoene dehydrogenase-like protein